MKITLAQAVHTLGDINKNIQELIRDRNEVAYVTATKGETYETPSQTVEEATAAIQQARADYRELQKLMRKANLENTIVWDGQEVSLDEAIEISKQQRGELNIIKGFGRAKKQQNNTNWRSDSTEVTYALFEPEVYRKAALKLEKQVRKLSQDIEAKNHAVEIEFSAGARYIEE